MAIDYQRIMNWDFGDQRDAYDKRRAILYALGIGYGAEPYNPAHLQFVYEGVDGADLKIAPTMPVVLGYPGFWLKDEDTGVDWRKVLHGEQGLTIHNPLPPAARLKGTMRVDEIVDKGKAAIIYTSRDLHDEETGTHYCTLTASAFCRGEGGFGGPEKAGPEVPLPRLSDIPDRAPDHQVAIETMPRQALIYRLSGDFNPLHADPEIATGAGFEKPILHGLCSYGVACRAVLEAICNNDPARLKGFDIRFSSPVIPGETLTTEIWDLGSGTFAWRTRVGERVVLDKGFAEIA